MKQIKLEDFKKRLKDIKRSSWFVSDESNLMVNVGTKSPPSYLFMGELAITCILIIFS